MADLPTEIEFLMKVIGAIAVVVALLLTWRTHAEHSIFELIDRVYNNAYTIEGHAIRDWRLAHLFCIGAQEYEQVKQRIKCNVSSDASIFDEYLVKEKLFAIHLFMVYEQIYFQWAHSSNILHKRRRTFLREILGYFTDRLLLNPRTLHFIQADPTGSGLHLERSSKAFLDAAIEKATPVTLALPVDAEGPFGPGPSSRAD